MSDPYRTAATFHCPRCGVELISMEPTQVCVTCRGVFVREDFLPDTVRHRMWWRDPELTCPACGAPMQSVLAGEETIDRCPTGDGFWFDRGELSAMLEDREGKLETVIAEVIRRVEEVA